MLGAKNHNYMWDPHAMHNIIPIICLGLDFDMGAIQNITIVPKFWSCSLRFCDGQILVPHKGGI